MSEKHPLIPKIIPDHESAVRRMLSDAHGQEFRPLRSLEEAKQCADGIAIFEGDWGGQIYLTCPVRIIQCSPQAVQQLLLDIDAKCWHCNEGEGARIYYERKSFGDGVWGGMGGAAVVNGLWLHEEVEGFEVRSQVEAILAGKLERLTSND